MMRQNGARRLPTVCKTFSFADSSPSVLFVPFVCERCPKGRPGAAGPMGRRAGPASAAGR